MRVNRRKSNSLVNLIVGIIIIIGFVVVICGNLFLAYGTRQTITATVMDKNIKIRTTGSGNDKKTKDVYMVYTQDEEGIIHVLEDTDTLMFFKFNSSDVYAQMCMLR